MAKKLHWTQTPEGRKRMSQIQKGRSKKRKEPMSRAEKSIRESTAAPEIGRMRQYEAIVKLAMDNNEVPKLMAEIREQALFNLREVMR